MTRDDAIREYDGPLEPTPNAWRQWERHLGRLHLERRITLDQATGEWDPPDQLVGEGTRDEQAALKKLRAYRRKAARAAKRIEARRERKLQEIERRWANERD